MPFPKGVVKIGELRDSSYHTGCRHNLRRARRVMLESALSDRWVKDSMHVS